MSQFRITILWLQWIIFRRRSIILKDHDGELNARVVHGYRKWIFAKRFGLSVSNVRIFPEGKLEGASYVFSWEPLFPGRGPFA